MLFVYCSLVIMFGVITVLILLWSYNERYFDSYPSAASLETRTPAPKIHLLPDLRQWHANTL